VTETVPAAAQAQLASDPDPVLRAIPKAVWKKRAAAPMRENIIMN